MIPRPFAGSELHAGVVVLSHGSEAGLAEFRTLLVRERHELESVLGGQLRFVDDLPTGFVGPVCLIGPAALNDDLARRRQGQSLAS